MTLSRTKTGDERVGRLAHAFYGVRKVELRMKTSGQPEQMVCDEILSGKSYERSNDTGGTWRNMCGMIACLIFIERNASVCLEREQERNYPLPGLCE